MDTKTPLPTIDGKPVATVAGFRPAHLWRDGSIHHVIEINGLDGDHNPDDEWTLSTPVLIVTLPDGTSAILDPFIAKAITKAVIAEVLA